MIGNTLLRKLAMAFITGFVPVFLYSLLGLLEKISDGTAGDLNFSVILSLVVSLIVGASAAGIRLVLARWTDFVPGDEIHSPGPPDAVVVTTEGTASTAINAEAVDSIAAEEAATT